MDRTLTAGRMLRCWVPVLASALVLVLAWPGAQAQALDDPTRPPAALWAPANAAPAGPAQPRLQSVLISSKRRVAVIDGQVVRVGSKVGDAEVVEIRDTAVLLRRGKSLETFTLYPDSKTGSRTERSTERRTDPKTDRKQE